MQRATPILLACIVALLVLIAVRMPSQSAPQTEYSRQLDCLAGKLDSVSAGLARLEATPDDRLRDVVIAVEPPAAFTYRPSLPPVAVPVPQTPTFGNYDPCTRMFAPATAD
jgi:hypothetical protein